VVKVGAAAAGEHTTGVHLESCLVGLDGDRDGAGCESRLQRVAALANAFVAGDSTTWDCGGVRRLARAITALVWVGGLGGNIGGACVIEGKLHAAAVASCVLCGAVHELLLGHGFQAARGNLPCTLHASGGGESPARSALALVLHRGDCTLGGPVNGCCKFLSLVLMHTHVWQALETAGLVTEAGCNLVLLGAQVRELILAELHVSIAVLGGPGHVGMVGCSVTILIAVVHLAVLGLERIKFILC